jgi:SpoVK/Ycf46/Vps4 family AAA+-type ATPase
MVKCTDCKDAFRPSDGEGQVHVVFGRGIILAGSPGTGKTLLVRAVAGERSAHIEIANGPARLSKWVGETETAVCAVFERA